MLATIERFGSLAEMLEHAEPKERAQLYDTFGVTATYDVITTCDVIAQTAVLEVALPRRGVSDHRCN